MGIGMSSANAMMSGSTGNEPVKNHFWPTGSEEVANLKTRVASWSGPIGTGDTFDYRARSTADLNEALVALAAVVVPRRELVLRNGPAESPWLKVMADRIKDAEGARIDWSFEVWQPVSWHQVHNNPMSHFGSDFPGFRRPVDPPRITAYFGGGGKLAWEKVKVPEGVTVIDQRGTPGEPPSITGSVYDMRTGKVIEGATVTVTPGRRLGDEKVELPVTETDAAGRFALKGFPEGLWVAEVSHPGYAPRYSASHEMFRGSDTREVTIYLSKAVQLSGVVRGSGGAAIEDVQVRAASVIASDGFGYPGPGGRKVMTDREGRFVLKDLPVGFVALSVQKVGLSSTADMTVLHEAPGKEPLEFVMSGTGTVRGVMKVKEGRQATVSIHPVGGEVIGSWGGSMHCRADGSFQFKNVPPGDYLVGPSRGDDMKEGEPGVRKVTVTVGGTVSVEVGE